MSTFFGMLQKLGSGSKSLKTESFCYFTQRQRNPFTFGRMVTIKASKRRCNPNRAVLHDSACFVPHFLFHFKVTLMVFYKLFPTFLIVLEFGKFFVNFFFLQLFEHCCQSCVTHVDLCTSNSLQKKKKKSFSLSTDLHLELFIYVSILN